MTVNILGTEYEILIQNDNPKMKDSDGFCEWCSKKIVITDSYRDDEDALENIDEYIHKVLRHEAFHALFAEMGMRRWLQDEELVDMLAMQYPKIRKIMDACDAFDLKQTDCEDIYPLVIIEDRYTGVYSNGKYTAWNMYFDEIPQDIDGDDVSCYDFWHSYNGIVGLGETPSGAIEDLRQKLEGKE